MADKIVTPGAVLASANAQIVFNGVAGAAITAGMPLYRDTGDANRVKPLDSNAPAPANVLAGIALNNAGSGQPVAYVVEDPDFTPGCPVDAGEVLVTSATAGGIAPVADVVSGWFVTVLGVGKGGNKINFKPSAAGVAVA